VVFEVGVQVFARQLNWGMENEGIGLGLNFGGAGLVSGLVLFMIGIYWWWIGKQREIEKSIFMIFTGGMANFISRLIGGGVWDYCCLPFGWWVSGGDIMITIGIFWQIWQTARKRLK